MMCDHVMKCAHAGDSGCKVFIWTIRKNVYEITLIYESSDFKMIKVRIIDTWKWKFTRSMRNYCGNQCW